MKKRYLVTLTDEERRSLRWMVSSGKGAAVSPEIESPEPTKPLYDG